MDTSLNEMRSQGVRDTFFDVASIIAVVLIGLVVLVLTQPRFGTDLDAVFFHQGTQSHSATDRTAAS